ncbi:MAG: NADP-dependent oxidoreductase [bacterium]|nr:NADP-dependent oxidoreductase [Gammaproteobacteria bacterium]HIL98684.1 NADP-dependent oxidoreductase [Pseudomonadales bacterium]
MSEIVSREIHLVSRPDGMPVPENFQLVENTLQTSAGDILVKNLYMSIDPAMRPPMSNGQTKLDEAMGGGAIGKVVESDDVEFPVGCYVQHRYGFREYCIAKAKQLQIITLDGEPLTTHLHVLGGTGFTAWGGLLVTGELKEGENVFVSAAAGAVGSVVGQIAKIKNCRVAGSCGSDEKVEYLTSELGFDYAFNYKTKSISKELHIGLPDGIDVYFENVGGKHLDAACGQMRPLGRIPVCGMISGYNNKGARSEGVTTLSNMIYNRVTMKGFVVYEFNHMRDQFLSDMRRWIADGKMKYRETIMNGIEEAPAAMIGLLSGENTGKMLVRLSDDD